ncbi:MAG: hypothetical protein LUH15_04500 [Tannerellaceae bacterium]|nr:hypothetical protein [Tannerellaceae bacterium]
MKKICNFMLCSLLIGASVLLAVSCTEESDSSNDLFYISTDIRTKVTEGIHAVSKTDKEGFQTRLDALIEKCNSPALSYISNASIYMETEEYIDFKNYIIEYAPGSYYLLIEIFLQGDVNIGPFTYMFQDIVEASYPGLIDQVLDQLENATMDEFIVAYSQVCVEYLLLEMGKMR